MNNEYGYCQHCCPPKWFSCRPDLGQSLVSAVAATKTTALPHPVGPASLARVSAPSVRGPQTAFPGPSTAVLGPQPAAAPAQRGSATARSYLERPTAPGPLGAALHSREANADAAGPLGSNPSYSQQPSLAQPSASGQQRQGSSQLPPTGAPAKTKSKGVMASVLGSVKKAVGMKSRTKDLQG